MARFVRSADVVVRRVAGEVVLVPIGRRAGIEAGPVASFHVLNTTGEMLWQRLETPVDEEQLTQAITTLFDVDFGRAAQDVSAFLAELLRCGAIETDPSPR